MALLCSHEEASVLTCHQPQIVVLISGSSTEGMVAAGDLDEVTGLNCVGLVDVTLLGVYLLNSEALGLVEFVVVDLLEEALGRHIVVVMLVRREGCPLSAMYERLTDVDEISLNSLVENEVCLSLPAGLAEVLDDDVLGLYQNSLVCVLGGALSYTDNDLLAHASDSEGGVCSYVNAGSRTVKYVLSLADVLEGDASETLADKINNGVRIEKDGKTLINKKSLDGFMKYATDEAKKLAEKGASSACVRSDVVFGWAIHYFEEESIWKFLITSKF